MKELILHIGASKCASSTLQEFLSNEFNDSHIAMEQNLVYCALSESGLIRGSNTKKIAHTSPSNYAVSNFPSTVKETKNLLQMLQRQTSKDERIILSNEGLANLKSPDFIKAFDELDVPISVFLLSRPPADWFNSSWWQWGCWEHSLDAWYEGNKKNFIKDGYFQWKQLKNLNKAHAADISQGPIDSFLEFIDVQGFFNNELYNNVSTDADLFKFIYKNRESLGRTEQNPDVEFQLTGLFGKVNRKLPFVLSSNRVKEIIDINRADSEALVSEFSWAKNKLPEKVRAKYLQAESYECQDDFNFKDFLRESYSDKFIFSLINKIDKKFTPAGYLDEKIYLNEIDVFSSLKKFLNSKKASNFPSINFLDGWKLESAMSFKKNNIDIFILKNNEDFAFWCFQKGVHVAININEFPNKALQIILIFFLKILFRSKRVDKKLLELIKQSLKRPDNKSVLFQKYLSQANIFTEENKILLELNEDQIEAIVSPMKYFDRFFTHSILINDYDFALKLKGSDILIFYSKHITHPVALYDFEKSIFITSSERENLFEDFISHINDYADHIENYLKINPSKNGIWLRNQHLGHLIWNELSAIEDIKSSNQNKFSLVAPSLVNKIINLEKFCGNSRFDFLVPDGNFEDFVKFLPEYAYTHGIKMFRPGKSFISQKLSKDILKYYLGFNNALTLTLHDFLKPFSKTKTIILNLRLENRTVVSPEKFYKGLVKVILDEFKDFNIELVFDGHNLFSGEELMSHCERPEHNLAQQEMKIVDEIQAEFSGKNIKIVNNINADISKCIYDICKSDFFISPWGAGLVKTCWILRKKGIVYTSRKNLNSREDLNIYSDKKIVENPSNIIFVNERYIHDLETETKVTTDNQGFNNNFEVNLDGIKELIKQI